MIALLRPFWPHVLLAGLCGSLAGLGTVALLAIVNRLLSGQAPLDAARFGLFALLCLVALAGRAIADLSINAVGQRLVAEVRRSLAEKILCAPIDALERYRSHRLIPVLTQDVDMISDVAFLLGGLSAAAAVLLGCLAYLAWLSPLMFAVVVLVLGAGTALQFLARLRGVRGFTEARDREDDLHKAYRDIASGAKELRLSRARRRAVFEGRIGATIDAITAINARAIRVFVLANALGSALHFLVIGIVLAAALAQPGLAPETLTGFVLVLLFIKGPLEQLLQTLPAVGRAQVAFRRIADLSRRFAAREPGLMLAPPASAAPAPQRIELRGVTYEFPAAEGAEPFRLGPVDLTLRRGEILFLVGENGAGKTTLIKLLLGLYAPREGALLVDGQALGEAERDGYRQLFSTVFADYHLFEELAQGEGARPDGAAREAELRRHLERLELSHKVAVRDGQLTTTDLSTGQRKRLALLQAWLERRPFLVFDEWAADQDPAFRRIFYTEFLPELRAAGHGVLVISHDDRYFHLADRLLRLERGRLVEMAGTDPTSPRWATP